MSHIEKYKKYFNKEYLMRKIAELDKNERFYHRTDEQLVQFAGRRPTFEKE